MASLDICLAARAWPYYHTPTPSVYTSHKTELWQRFLAVEDEILADLGVPEHPDRMAASSSADSKASVNLTPKDKDQAVSLIPQPGVVPSDVVVDIIPSGSLN